LRIYQVGADRTDKVLDFERYALSKGCEVLMMSPNTDEMSTLDGKPAGVVIFDDGKFTISEWLAKIREHSRYLSTPVVAVASRRESDFSSRLIAAGASAVCDYDNSSEQILQEVITRCNTEPVIEEIRKSLLKPFNDAAIMTLRDMAGLDVTVRSTYQKTNYKMFGDISAVVGLTARTEGAMVISFPEKTAIAVSRRVLSGVVEEVTTDIMRDCIGEIANVIVGQARGMLSGTPYQFAMSTPTVVSGVGHEIRHKPGMPCLVVAFCSDEGEFALQICLGA
jgi:chemotaxis protein CheX